MDYEAHIDDETTQACFEALAQIEEFKEGLAQAFEKLVEAVEDPSGGSHAAIQVFHQLVNAIEAPTRALVREYHRLTGVHLPIHSNDPLSLSGESFLH